MSLRKRLLKSNAAIWAISFLLSLYIRLVYLTSRKVRHVDVRALPYLQGKDNAIFAFWHGRMMIMPAFNPKRKMHVLISLHRDGTLISRTIGFFGQVTISGSTSRGGEAAARDILDVLEAGDNVSITPDGPRGPAQVVAGGIATFARLSKKPIIPVTFSTTRGRHFRSWDRFLLGLPFGRIEFFAGAPILIADNADENAARLQVEQAMNALVEAADRQAHG